MPYWVVRHADGSETRHVTNGDDPTREGIDLGVEHAETGRAGTPTEQWDWEAGEWRTDEQRERARLEADADADFRAEHGDLAKALSHVVKVAEANAYRRAAGRGTNAWPMLTAEADAVGIDLSELVSQVLDNHQSLIEGNTARRVAKVLARMPSP